MNPALLLALLPSRQDPSRDPPALHVGEKIASEITDTDPEVHTPTLDTTYADVPTVGKGFRIEVEFPGTYTIELRSYLFDAYLVLRSESGVVLAEDDDGLMATHPRLVHSFEPGQTCLVEACALHGERGSFELRLARGEPRALSPEEGRAAERGKATVPPAS